MTSVAVPRLKEPDMRFSILDSQCSCSMLKFMKVQKALNK